MKKGKFNIFNQIVFEKTQEFWDIYNPIIEKIETKPLIEIICNNTKSNSQIRLMSLQKTF